MSQDTATEQRQPPGTQPDPFPPTIESTLAESVVVSTQEATEGEQEQGADQPVPSMPKRVFLPNWSNIIACILFLILVGEHVVPLLLPVLDSYVHPKARVTLFAARQQVTFPYTFFAVTGTADLSHKQIASRFVSFTTPTKTIVMHTTGTGYTPAIQARGEVTLYNEAPYPQTIQRGTVLTGHDEVQVITDETASIGAGNGGTNGSATVPAHAMVGGTGGNIQPLDVNTLCCLSGILAKNSAAFTGGTDPQAYPVVSRADLQTAARQLASVLDPLARKNLHSQIAESERVLTALQCSSATSSNPNVGEKATEAVVFVAETCKAQVIDDHALQEQVRVLFATDAANTLQWAGVVQRNSLSLTLATPLLLDKSHHTYQLAVSASGTLVFQLSDTQLHRLVMRITGKKITEAQRLLLAIKGVQGVSITPAYPEESTLPTDPGRIHMLVLA
jgi:hypothetical protein